MTAGFRSVPCALCRQPILEGARKCKHCKRFQPDRAARAPRAAIMMGIAVASVFSVILTSHESVVGSAPPLTAIEGEPAASTNVTSLPRNVVPAPAAGPRIPAPPPKSTWKGREIRMGDVHPLDLAFSKGGQSVFVSADDATLREYSIDTGEIVHKTTLPVKGDRVVAFGEKYVALINSDPGVTQVPVFDVTRWDHDPVLLEVGAGPTDLREMPDGTVVVGGSASHRLTRFAMPSGRRLDDMTLPQAASQVFLLTTTSGHSLAALGALSHAGRPDGAWMDLFDPKETPFGATRRSIAVGRDPRFGSVTSAGNSVFFPDFAANKVRLVDVGEETKTHSADVGQGPIAAFVMHDDQYGVTLNAGARTATTVNLPMLSSADKAEVTTLMLPDEPRRGRLSPDRSLLFVVLGPAADPTRGRGVVVIGGEPPDILATVETGLGAHNVTVSPDGTRAAVANYFAKSITILE